MGKSKLDPVRVKCLKAGLPQGTLELFSPCAVQDFFGQILDHKNFKETRIEDLIKWSNIKKETAARAMIQGKAAQLGIL